MVLSASHTVKLGVSRALEGQDCGFALGAQFRNPDPFAIF